MSPAESGVLRSAVIWHAVMVISGRQPTGAAKQLHDSVKAMLKAHPRKLYRKTKRRK